MSYAVNSPKTPNKVETIDTNDISFRETFLKYLYSYTVLRAPVRWNKNHTIGDIEICITCRQSIPMEINRRRHRKC